MKAFATHSKNYRRVHSQIRATRGSAGRSPCWDRCGRWAEEWSWTHGEDPNNIWNYLPRCKKCHGKYDYEYREELRLKAFYESQERYGNDK